MQLTEYFNRRRRTFDLPLAPNGTPFQNRGLGTSSRNPVRRDPILRRSRQVARWDRLASDQKSTSGREGQRDNPIPIIVPCHRVIGADGSSSDSPVGSSGKRASSLSNRNRSISFAPTDLRALHPISDMITQPAGIGRLRPFHLVTRSIKRIRNARGH